MLRRITITVDVPQTVSNEDLAHMEPMVREAFAVIGGKLVDHKIENVQNTEDAPHGEGGPGSMSYLSMAD